MTKKRVLLLTGIAIVALAGWALYASVSERGNTLEGSGTVEARNIRVGSKVGGRILRVHVREGDLVEPGQVLVTFEDQELLAALNEARANFEKMERGFRPEEIAEARAAEAQARADYELRRSGSRREDIAAAKADVDRMHADAIRAGLNYKRADALASEGIFSKTQLDDAEATWKMAVAAQRNAEEKLAELERGFRPEEIASAKARYQQTEATRLKIERGNRLEDIEAARASLLNAEARYREREVLAPSAATVEVLDIRPGDLVAPNTPIATLLEHDQMYVRIYVSEPRIGQVHVRQKADVHLDAIPGQTISATVEQINQRAEFLPRNVQTKEERVHQVFGVKLRINDPSGRVRAGMAADVKLHPREN